MHIIATWSFISLSDQIVLVFFFLCVCVCERERDIFYPLAVFWMRPKIIGKVKLLITQWCLILCDAMDQPLCPWNSPGKNTRVASHFLLQRIFPTQGSNPGLLHCRDSLPSEPTVKPVLLLVLEGKQLSILWSVSHMLLKIYIFALTLGQLVRGNHTSLHRCEQTNHQTTRHFNCRGHKLNPLSY